MYIMSQLAKFMMSLSSFSGVIYFYIVTNVDAKFAEWLSLNVPAASDIYIRHFVYLLVFGLFALLSLKVSRLTLPKEDSLTVKEIKPIESVAVPTYIGLFVIAIGLQTTPINVSIIILIVLFLFWTRLEKIFYFNPIWLFFGYRFYEIKSDEDNVYTLITKKDRLKGKQSLVDLRRINNYTFLESK